jgi:uncharacterized membrane protein
MADAMNMTAVADAITIIIIIMTTVIPIEGTERPAPAGLFFWLDPMPRTTDALPMSNVLLDAILRPNPPMSPRVLLIVLVVVTLFNVAFALSFVLRGAWPVAPFMGLDVALLAWGFRASTRAARRYEHLTLTVDNLRILRQPVKGEADEVALNPYWVRVEMDDPPEPWSQLTLWSHGKSLQIGSFMSPDARAAFAGVLRSALRRARETVPA